MAFQFPLRSRIFLVLSLLVGITVGGGLVMIWYTYRMEALMGSIIESHLSALQNSEALEIALVNQKGYVTYFMLDHDPEWLHQLEKYRRIFLERLEEARRSSQTPDQRDAIARIESQYQRYVRGKDQVIAHYKAGESQKGELIHKKIRQDFFTLLELCEKYKAMHSRFIREAMARSHTQAYRLRLIAVAAMVSSIVLAVALMVILVSQILAPLKRLFEAAGGERARTRPPNEVAALSQRVHGLMEDVDQTQLELARSRESLQQAEKLALVGKLAAGMAHSIRNPFTSVKMRLFSLNRSLELNSEQTEDFEVISQEIRHIDTIVQNFLEFSRPPKLKMQIVSPSSVVDMAIQLLHHRLKSYDVTVTVARDRPLPEVEADPEQLKEVLVNIVINACEAMETGGHIDMVEAVEGEPGGGRQAVLRITDNGPGIPEELRDKLFQPFFTTKEEGTGLGLSIAERIVSEHHGRITVQANGDGGTTFVICLPVKERQ